MALRNIWVAVVLAVLAGCVADDGQDGAPGADATGSTVALRQLSSFRNPSSGFDESAAEIVAFDASTEQLFIVNAESGLVDVVDLAAPDAPVLFATLDVAADIAAARDDVADATELGASNSVAVRAGLVAVAVEASPKTDPGFVAFYQASGSSLLAVVRVGALPDMVAFAPDGSVLVTANEGEPSDDYRVDPPGTVSLIDLSGGASALIDADVTTLDFTAFNAGGARAAELDGKLRLPAPLGATVAQDLEPEYVAISADSRTAWVALQENSGFAEIDLVGASITALWGTGTKDFALPGNALDPSNRDGGIQIANWPVRGLFMPNAIAAYRYAGRDYLVTANEGDGREYLFDTDAATCTATPGLASFDDPECLVYLDEIRVRDIVDPGEVGATISVPGLERYPGGSTDSDADTILDIFENEALGRLKVIATEGLADASCLNDGGQPTAACEYQTLVSFGARSFSIFDAQARQLVFDSGSEFERITAQRLGADGFNASNDENAGDDRSDDKGPEPEAVALAEIEGRVYAFIGLERVGGIMVYDISEPESARFVQYLNNRDFSVSAQNPDDSYNPAAGDLGPEGMLVVPAAESPNGQALLIVGNEVSGTTTIYAIDTVRFDP